VLHLDEMISSTVTMGHLLSSDLSTPVNTRKSPLPSTSTPNHPPESDSPTKLMNGNTRPLQAPDFDSSLNSPSMLSSNGTPANESNNPWSSAVGKAAAGGKSGRVIERLMNDNDRLQREKKLAVVRLEEETKRGESARSALDSLQVSNEVLTSLHETDASILLKRDRRIQELKGDLESERLRRNLAETEVRETRLERDDTIEKLRREATDEREQSRRATTQYDILSKSWKSLESRYLKQAELLKADLSNVRLDIDSDKRKLAQLEVITEQLRQEAEKSRRAKQKLQSDVQDYKLLQEAGMRQIRNHAHQNDAANDRAQQEMQVLLGEMKYVLNVKRDVKGAG